MKKRITSILLTLVMLIGMTPFSAFAATGATGKYLDAEGVEQNIPDADAITTETTSLTAGWYTVSGTIEINSRINASGGAVNIVLMDGADLTVHGGIGLSNAETSLAIYAQSTGGSMGKLTVDNVARYYAGIGAGSYGSCGNIMINGGTVTANGGTNAAGIGSGNRGRCGDIIITGGIVTASESGSGASIGSGYIGTCGDITISGGTVTAFDSSDELSHSDGAGIGSGGGNNGMSANCGDITISGGTVTANGAYASAGIGTGGRGICGDITISGGVIAATGVYYGAGIGTGYESECNGGITISGGVIAATGGYFGAGIGTGYKSKCDSGITISDGYIKAATGGNADRIGQGYGGSGVSTDFASCKTLATDYWYYVNYVDVEGSEPTCTEFGYKESYKALADEQYYSALPCDSGTLIGDGTALAEWQSEGHSGSLAPLGHTDANHDRLCDRCGGYFYYDINSITLDRTEDFHVVTEINSSVNDVELTSGWYGVKGNVEVGGSLTINGDVHLILADGSALTVKKGVILTEGNSLTIYVQSFGSAMGRISATGNLVGGQIYSAGIGGYSGADGKYASGKLTINGGSITATGGLFSAGIGGSSTTDCGEVTINAGVITAIGGLDAAGIGGGENGSLTKLTINGDATVTARGNGNGFGIGGGVNGNGGEVRINSGVAIVYGGENAAAFGKDSQVRLGTKMAAYEIVDRPTSYDPSITKEVIGGKLSVNDDGTVAVGTCKKAIVEMEFQNDGPDGPIIPFEPEHEHLGYIQRGVAPTSSTSGYKDFYICSCGKFFEDRFSKTEITDLNAWVSVGGRGYLAPLGGGSSGGSESSYKITVNESVHGSISADKKSAYSGSTVTLTAAPEKGWTVETITVLDKNGKSVEIKNLGGNKYSFCMPSGAVTVSATFMEDNTMLNFCMDVKAGDYCYEAVLWAYLNGITDGVDNVRFGPNETVTRGQVVTFLWRAAGQPEPASQSSFSDVSADAYYAKAVAWAVENGITDGVGGGKFAPSNTCTRAEIVTFLWRYAGAPVVNYAMNFEDVPSGQYYTEAVRWAVAMGITQGTSAATFTPSKTCTRAETVTFLYRFSAVMSAAAAVAAGDMESALVQVGADGTGVLIMRNDSDTLSKGRTVAFLPVVTDEFADLIAGGALTIQIRGMGSNTASNVPLVVGGLQDFQIGVVNSGDIELIKILKDASTTAIYGAQGANVAIGLQGKVAGMTITGGTGAGKSVQVKDADVKIISGGPMAQIPIEDSVGWTPIAIGLFAPTGLPWSFQDAAAGAIYGSRAAN